TMDAVSGIMIEDQGPDYVLRAKTGWGVAPDPDVGWYVGSVVRAERPYFFALNLEVHGPDDVAARREVAHAILRSLDLL
ncbi:MAG: class D beta-lactamase, partial [Bacteroidota bacterium]